MKASQTYLTNYALENSSGGTNLISYNYLKINCSRIKPRKMLGQIFEQTYLKKYRKEGYM